MPEIESRAIIFFKPYNDKAISTTLILKGFLGQESPQVDTQRDQNVNAAELNTDAFLLTYSLLLPNESQCNVLLYLPLFSRNSNGSFGRPNWTLRFGE